MRLAVLAHALSTDLRSVPDRARAAGFDGLVIDPLAFPAVLDPSRTAQREIVHLLARAGQPLVGIDVRMGNDGLAKDLDREVDRVQRAIDVARGLGGTTVLCDLGPLPPAPDESATKPAIAPAALGKLILPDPPAAPRAVVQSPPRDPAFEASVNAGLQAIADRANRAGCIIAFRASLGSFSSLAAALSRVDCPFFGIDLDPLSMLADAWTLDELFSRLGGSIRHVRGRDGLRGTTGRVVASELGTGHVVWTEVITALRDSDYRGAITLDPSELSIRSSDAVARGAARLRERLI